MTRHIPEVTITDSHHSRQDQHVRRVPLEPVVITDFAQLAAHLAQVIRYDQ